MNGKILSTQRLIHEKYPDLCCSEASYITGIYEVEGAEPLTYWLFTNRKFSAWQVRGIEVVIYEQPDGALFVGASRSDEHLCFPPRFFDSVELALVYLKVTANIVLVKS
jgi:hypothetical protein